jgi:hypothetical protein
MTVEFTFVNMLMPSVGLAMNLSLPPKQEFHKRLGLSLLMVQNFDSI